MVPYPRINSFDIDPARFSAMMEEFRAYSETEEKKMPKDYEEMEQENRLYPWIDDEEQEWDVEDGDWDDEEDWDEEYEYDDDMDGDWDSGMTSAGWGTDEDYGYYGEDY